MSPEPRIEVDDHAVKLIGNKQVLAGALGSGLIAAGLSP
jgi:hypothetical protein